MDTFETQSEPVSNEKKSNNLKKWFIGLGIFSTLTILTLACGVFLAFDFIRTRVQAVPLTIPLVLDQPLLNRIAYTGSDSNIWIVSPDGENRRSITSDKRGYQFPTWAPNNSRLAFIGPDEADEPALYVSSPNLINPTIIYQDPASAPFYLYWAPDSTSLTFLTQENNGLTMRLADSRTPGLNRALAEGAPFYWAWSPDSDKVLMHVGGSRALSEEAHISLLENQQDAERVELKLAPGQFQAPIWSTDGNHIYYIAADEEGDESIFRTNVHTFEENQLSDLGGYAFMVLSPDDRNIAYLQIGRNSRPPFGKAHLVDTDGKATKRLSDDLIASMYWSPDGKKLALLSLGRAKDGPTAKVDGLAAPLSQRAQLRWWIYDLESEELSPLTSFVPTTPFLQTVPYFDQYHLSLTFWSPDSRYLVVTKKNEANNQGTVWVYDSHGEEEARKIADGTLAVWSWK